MNSIVITMDGMVLQRNASLTLISITFKGSLFPEIIQCRYYLEGRARRVSSIGCSVQKTAVILIIYKTLPVLLNGIGIKIRGIVPGILFLLTSFSLFLFPAGIVHGGPVECLNQ